MPHASFVFTKPCSCELQAEFYQTRANAGRVAMVELYSCGEINAGAGAESLDSSVSTISRHLRNIGDKTRSLPRWSVGNR